MYHHRGCLNNPIFSNLELCAVCWARFMSHHELRPTSVSPRFSSLNSSLGLAEGKHYLKIAISIFKTCWKFSSSRLLSLYSVLLLSFLLCFHRILFCCYLFPFFSGWFVIAVCLLLQFVVYLRLRGKTTTRSALDGAVFDIAQILAYLVHNMSRSQLHLGFGHFGWLPSFSGQ